MNSKMRIQLQFIAVMVISVLGMVGTAAAQTPNQAASSTTAPSVAPRSGNSQPLAIDAKPISASDTTPAAAGSSDAESLKQLIGVNPSGLKRADLPKLPVMSLSGFVQPHNGKASALLQIADLNRTFLVEEGTQIPITVPGRISPIGRSELIGLNQTTTPPTQANDANSQSQIILKVVRVSDEGVTVEAGLIDQTIVVR
jgi:hypothetical protein